MIIQDSALYVGLLLLLMLVLGGRISLLRQKHRVSMGSADHADLQRAIRVFGNFTEWAPMLAAALVLCEIVGAPSIFIHVVGIVLVVARILHPIGLRPDRTTAARGAGAGLTLLCALCMGVYLVYASVL